MSRIIWCFLFITLSLQSCYKNTNEQPKLTIAFSQCVGDDAWRNTMLEEMKRELSFYPHIDFIYRDANNNNEKQQQQLLELAKLQPDVIIVSPNEAEPLTPVINVLFQSGIPIVVTDRKTSSQSYNAYVGADNYEIGYMAGHYLANRLKYQGKITEITGLPGSSATIERQNGFHTALSSHPDIEVLPPINGKWLIDTATLQATIHLEQLHTSDAIFAYNDQMALGVHKTLAQKSPDYKTILMGVDALSGRDNGLELVSKKILEASMLYPTGGKEAIRTAIAILNDAQYDRDLILNTLVVDSTNVALMMLQNEKIISQQKDIDQQQAAYLEQQRIFSDQQRILNILVVSLALAVIFAAISFYTLRGNWEKNKQLELQNTAILKQQQQILAMTAEVEKATEAKINFFTNISHEFKTPLSLIRTPLADIIKNSGKQSVAEIKDELVMMHRNAVNLERLVSQVVDLRRVGYENLRIRAQKQSLLLFCNEMVQVFRMLAKKKSINLRLENNIQESYIWFDKELMTKVMYNLLSNAFKYTTEKSEILVKIMPSTISDDSIQLIVSDTGCGISPTYIEHIFEPFYRGSYDTDGSGIGLALCKKIIELHHANIDVKSEVNVGTTIYIRLSTRDDIFTADEKEENTVHHSFMPIPAEPDDFSTADRKYSDTAEEHSILHEFSVLLIDDHKDLLAFLSQKLAKHYTVYSATNAHDGLAKAYSHIPDIIISDIMMPGSSGIELVKKLKADVRTTHIPIILLTAKDADQQKITGLETLADAYITKPFNLDYLITCTNNLINNRQALAKYFSSEVQELNTKSNLSLADKQFLNEINAFIDENLQNSALNIDLICDRLSLSRIQLYRKAKTLLHSSVSDFITAKRLKKSMSLLQQGVPVNIAAYECGFSSPAYFSTSFKNKYGVSPSSVKKKN